MFKLFKKPPEIPEELDFLAGSPANTLDPPAESSVEDEKQSQDIPAGVGAKRAAKESSRHRWPVILLGLFLAVAISYGTYWCLKMYFAPVPAEIPQGDILASLTSNPSAAPPSNTLPAPQPPAQQKQDQQKISKPEPPAAPSAPPAEKPSAPPAAPPKPVQLASPSPQPEMSQESAKQQEEALSGIFGANPFIDLSSLRSMVTASSGAMDLPRFDGTGNMALPNVPRPSVSPDLLPAPGEIQVPAAPAGVSSPPTMGGIIQGHDGSAIAIMGDGTVLSEGDTYRGDRRVTFIGGEGIQFDDGVSIGFSGQKK